MRPFSLEPAIGVVLRVGTAVASVVLAIGFALSFVPATGALSHTLLVAGIFVLLFTPVARVVVSLIDFLLNRDWLFVALNSIVLFLLGSAFIAALM
jgi:uncharacterized membrane protein